MTRLRLFTEETGPGALPLICLVCGQPAASFVPHSFSWRPTWVGTAFRVGVYGGAPLLLLSIAGSFLCLPVAVAVVVGLFCVPVALGLLIVAIVQTRRKSVECPLCDRHRNYWSGRGLWIAVPMLILGLAVLALAILEIDSRIPGNLFGPLFGSTIALFVVWIIVAILLHRRGIRCVEMNPESLVLDPVSPEFAATVRFERQREPAPAREPEDVYDPYPSAKSEL